MGYIDKGIGLFALLLNRGAKGVGRFLKNTEADFIRYYKKRKRKERILRFFTCLKNLFEVLALGTMVVAVITAIITSGYRFLKNK